MNCSILRLINELLHPQIDKVHNKMTPPKKQYLWYSLNYCISPTHPCLFYWTCVNCKHYGNLLSLPSQKKVEKIYPCQDSNLGLLKFQSNRIFYDELDSSAIGPAFYVTTLLYVFLQHHPIHPSISPLHLPTHPYHQNLNTLVGCQ